MSDLDIVNDVQTSDSNLSRTDESTSQRRKRNYRKSAKSKSPKSKQAKKSDTTNESLFKIPPSPQTATPQTADSLPKPPPIMVKGIDSYTKFNILCKNLTKLVGDDNFHCRDRTDDMIICSKTSDAYRQIVNHLRENNADFHCYQLKEDRCYRVVIRGLHHKTPVQEIKTELINKQFQVIRVHQIIQATTKTPLPLYFVDLVKSKKSQEIFNLQYLLYTKIKIEEPRTRNNLTQCARCLQFGHTKNFCNHPARCVKCAGSHQSHQCTLPLETPATCLHCGGAHPANYKGCTTYRDLQETRKARQTGPAAPTSSVQQPRPAPPQLQPQRNTMLSYAQVATSQSAQYQTATTAPSPTDSYTSSHPKSSNIPPPTPNVDILTSLTSQFTSFLTDFKSLITPLISLLTSLVQELLPRLSR